MNPVTVIPIPEPTSGQDIGIFEAIGNFFSNIWDEFMKLFN